MKQVAQFFGFDRIDQAEQAKALAAIRDREAAEEAALAIQRSVIDRLKADGLIRSPEARTRCTDELDAAADTFYAAGMGDIAAMLRGDL